METARDILKKIRAIELKTRRILNTAFTGQYRSVFKGRGMNFEEVREYQPGDEVRAIDWNVTARMGDAFIKKFTEERELTVMLLVDVSASGEFGSVELSKRELIAEVACLFAFSAIKNSDKVGCILFSDHVELFIPPAKGRSHALRIIREILFFQPKGRGTDLAGALTFLNRVLHRRSIVMLLSDLQVPDFDAPLQPLRLTARRHDLVALRVVDPRELEMPDVGRVVFEDAESGERIVVNTSDRRARVRYAETVAEWGELLPNELRRCGVDPITLSTDQDYVPALRRFFRDRERRQALA